MLKKLSLNSRAKEAHSIVALVRPILQVCLFSYGQTGAGKTHTMLGCGTGDQRGIIPRAVEKVLEQSESLQEKGWEFAMEASYLEIYNEKLRDLLAPGSAHSEVGSPLCVCLKANARRSSATVLIVSFL